MRRSILFAAAMLSTTPVFARNPPPTAGTQPRSMVPAPLPPGEKADIPGGSSRNGVVRPPPIGDRAIRHTPSRSSTMMVIPPGASRPQREDGSRLAPR